MRTEEAMLRLIVDTARDDERIRAAYLEGSRANPAAPRDLFQDYDVVYIVTTTRPFISDRAWIDRFGERLAMQLPEENPLYPSEPDACYGWLIQLADGVRLDLHVCTADYALANLELYRILLDKDGVLPLPAETTDARYHVRRPDAAQFEAVCADFWWCLNNVGKGLWRGELPYALDTLDQVVRPQLKQLLIWRAGADNGFAISAGKSGKYLRRYLPEAVYGAFLSTYAPAQTDALWAATFRMCDLFAREECALAARLSLPCDEVRQANTLRFLRAVQELPADATDFTP